MDDFKNEKNKLDESFINWFKKRRWDLFGFGVLILFIVGILTWYFSIFIDNYKFEKSLRPIFIEYSFIVDDINKIFSSNNITIKDFNDKANSISGDISALKSNLYRIDIPNKNSSKVFLTLLSTINLALEGLEKSRELNDIYVSSLTKEDEINRMKNYYYYDESSLIDAKNELKDINTKLTEKQGELKIILGKYIDKHKEIVNYAKKMNVNITLLEFKPSEETSESKKEEKGEFLGKIKVLSDVGLNVRSGPGTDYEPIDVLVSNRIYEYYDKKGDWYKVKGEEDKIGWACGFYNGEKLIEEVK